MLSCEICEIFKNNYFEQHLWATASKLYLKGDSTNISLWILWIIKEFCRASTNDWLLNTCARVFRNLVNLTAWRLLTVLE